MKRVLHLVHFITDQSRELRLILGLRCRSFVVRDSRESLPFVVSMTSYPPRIRRAWIAIETILQQSIKPESFILVLAEEEFPERRIPKILKRQTRRGLKIVWVGRNGRSFDKLLPALEMYPLVPVVTVDDDKHFPRDLLASLWGAHLKNPNSIIGARGWKIKKNKAGAVVFGDSWERINQPTKGQTIHLPGGNGTLYPPNSLSSRVTSLDEAFKICPTTDDIWFWANALRKNTQSFCLGLPPHRPVKSLRRSPALADVNRSIEKAQFDAVVSLLNLMPLIESQLD